MAADKPTKPRAQDDPLDKALAESFPASDPVSLSNPSTGTKSPASEEEHAQDQDLDTRIRLRAEKLWREANSPASGVDAFLDDARTLIAIEDNPKAGTLPNPMTRRDNIGPEGEPIEPTTVVANEGEFPTLTDQGEQTYPPRRPRRG
jgi:hypothetical protein